MTVPLFASYYRVSTNRQGQSGLGLDAQKTAVRNYLDAQTASLAAEFVEVESGKGANALERRPQLRAALAFCRRRAAVLLIAKLDRLARNVHFITGLIESGVDFVAVDMPHASKTMLQIFAVMGEWERDQISARVRAALAAAKARGVVLGATWQQNCWPEIQKRKLEARRRHDELRPYIEEFTARGLTHRQIADQLNSTGVLTARGRLWNKHCIEYVVRALRDNKTSARPS